MPLIFNGHRGELMKTAQQAIYHTGDGGDVQSGLTRPTYTVYSAGSPYTGTSNIDLPHYCNNTISFSVGKREVITGTVVATITQAGNGTFTVTAANSANLAAGKAISVVVSLNDTAILVAGKARTVLAADADVGAFFNVGGTGANIVLYAKTSAANDTTMKVAWTDGTSIGITSANSSITTTGDTTTYCIYDTASDTNQTGTTTNGNKVISGLTSTAGLIVGMSIGGNGVGAASTIASIDSATQVTGTVNSTVTNTVNITFTSVLLFTTLKTSDTLVIKGTASNNTTFTVVTGATANVCIVTESVTSEAAGNYVTIYKRAAISNNVVYDETSKLTYLRYTTGGPVLKLGIGSDGLLNWYDATACFIIYPADGNLSMDASAKQLKITGGSGLANRFNVGTFLQFYGFTIANNNRAGGYRCDAVTVSGSDLLLTLWTGYGVDGSQTGTTHNGTNVIDGLTDTSNLRIGMRVTGTNVGTNVVISTITSATAITVSVVSGASPSTTTITFTTLATEAVGGTRGIRLVCQDIFSFAAAANLVSVGGFADWRIPEDIQLVNLRRMGTTITGTNQANASPNATAFPSWPTGNYLWSSTTNPNNTSYAMNVIFYSGYVYYNNKYSLYYASLLRG